NDERVTGAQRPTLGYQGEGDLRGLAGLQRADDGRLQCPTGVKPEDGEGEESWFRAAMQHRDVEVDLGTGTGPHRWGQPDLRRPRVAGAGRGSRPGHPPPFPAVVGAVPVTDGIRRSSVPVVDGSRVSVPEA